MGEQPVIEYGMKTGWKLPRWAVRSLVVFVVAVLVYVGGLYVPAGNWKVVRGCSICGVGERDQTFNIAGWRVWRTVKKVETYNEQRYDTLVGVPHEHDWQRIAVVTEHGSLWGYYSIGEAGPDWRGYVARESLDFLESTCKNLPKEERQAIHARLIATKDRGEFDEIMLAVARKAARERK